MPFVSAGPIDSGERVKFRFHQFAASDERPLTRDVRVELSRRLRARFGREALRPAPQLDRPLSRLRLRRDGS
jgi:hypothetical protein